MNKDYCMYLRFGKLCVFSIAGCYLGDLLAELPGNYGQGCQRILSLDMRDTRLTRWDISPDYGQGCHGDTQAGYQGYQANQVGY